MKRMLKILQTVFAVLIFMSSLNALETKKTRPSVALVLAGGGARGFVHIPFLELIDELGIPVDMIAGTSAGAIIGGLYCAGYSPKEIKESILFLDWANIFRNDTFSPFEHALQNHSMPANPAVLKLGANMSLKLGKGLLTGQKAYEHLKALTVKIPSYIDFDSLPVSFRAAATDLLTGELVVFDQGDLAEAMRASMSIPGFFEPFVIDGKNYIDGSARDNLPIRTAKELNYDIVIAIEISNPLATDSDSFETSPLKVLEQMTSMQQAIKGKTDYNLADLVMFPDIKDFSMMDYFKAEDIYKRGKAEAERYRGSLIELKKKIFPQSSDGQNNDSEEQTKNGGSVSDGNFKFVAEKTDEPPKSRYAEFPYMHPAELILKGCKAADKRYMENLFEKTAGEAFDEHALLRFTHAAMNTGNYTAVIPRIDMRGGKNILELYLKQKPDENGLLLQSAEFAGTATSSSSGSFTLSTALQFRGLSGTGSALSLRVSYVNNTAFDFLFFQPLGPKVFFQTKASVSHEPDFYAGNFDFHPVSGSLLRRASVKAGTGILFNPHHTLVNEAAIHWLDTRQAIPPNAAGPLTSHNGNTFDFAADICSIYTFSNLDYRSFPTRGFFTSTTLSAVFPVGSAYTTRIFEQIKSDFTAAVPISPYVTLLCSLSAGTGISERLKKLPSLVPVYGFNLKDRQFFPHISGKRKFGVHKAAAALGLQIQPWRQLTILGGQLFFSLNGAAGDVWPDFETFLQKPAPVWRISAGTGIRIKEMFSVRVCAGAGKADGKISPFIACDFGTILY